MCWLETFGVSPLHVNELEAKRGDCLYEYTSEDDDKGEDTGTQEAPETHGNLPVVGRLHVRTKLLRNARILGRCGTHFGPVADLDHNGSNEAGGEEGPPGAPQPSPWVLSHKHAPVDRITSSTALPVPAPQRTPVRIAPPG